MSKRQEKPMNRKSFLTETGLLMEGIITTLRFFFAEFVTSLQHFSRSSGSAALLTQSYGLVETKVIRIPRYLSAARKRGESEYVFRSPKG
jgi:hypothetical protein